MNGFGQIFLQEWHRVPQVEFQQQVTYFLSQKPDWLESHPNVFENPAMQTAGPLMSHRSCTVDGKPIFLFVEDLRDLLS